MAMFGGQHSKDSEQFERQFRLFFADTPLRTFL